MKTKPGTTLDQIDLSGLDPIVRIYFQFNTLKSLYRQGWLRRGVPEENCESVAEHSIGVLLLALLLARTRFPELDQQKVCCMALLHDFGEIYTGDIIPSDGISDDQKYSSEFDSVHKVFNGFSGGNDLIQIWEEFQAGQSAEAILVRQVDKLEMGLQAEVYEASGFNGMQEFIDSALNEISEPYIRSYLKSG